MKLFKLIPLIGFVVLIFAACCGDKMCADNDRVMRTPFRFQNFTAAELDSVKIREYRASSNFTMVLDSIGYTVFTSDSLNYTVAYDSAQTVVPDSDMSILVSFHHDSLVYRITDITYQSELCRKCYGNKLYSTRLAGYKVNGVAANLTSYQWGIVVTK